MYFSISQSADARVHKAEQLLSLPAREFETALMSSREHAHIPFESSVAKIATAKAMAPEIVARNILATPEFAERAMRVGADEIYFSFGTEKSMKQFFGGALSSRHLLRFESVGGVSDDVSAVKNRVACSAMTAYWERLESNVPGVMPAERDYVDLLKDVRSKLEAAMASGFLSAADASDVARDIELASITPGLMHMTDFIQPLQEMARDELFEEQRARLMERYSA
ncbi:hypothetical protein, partial [Ralstonia sp. ASV6]|uniref:hypothetical protein n=1 Tax=Ralstonia sp. ASV6 TaxID=2795124 RepID=UPI0018EDFF1D